MGYVSLPECFNLNKLGKQESPHHSCGDINLLIFSFSGCEGFMTILQMPLQKKNTHNITPALIPPRRQKCKLHFPMAAAQVSEITENPLDKCNLDHEVPTSYQQTSKCNVTFLPSYSRLIAQSEHQVRK